MIGFYQPLSRRWAMLVEANASPTHRILAKWSALAQLERNFGKGWVGSAGYRRTVFNTAQVNTGTFSAERYFSSYRVAYTLCERTPRSGNLSKPYAANSITIT